MMKSKKDAIALVLALLICLAVSAGWITYFKDHPRFRDQEVQEQPVLSEEVVDYMLKPVKDFLLEETDSAAIEQLLQIAADRVRDSLRGRQVRYSPDLELKMPNFGKVIKKDGKWTLISISKGKGAQQYLVLIHQDPFMMERLN